MFTLAEAAEQFDFERVNKAGAKFDWDKLNWLNGQYIHPMPAHDLATLFIPYWQEAGYEFDAESDRPWLERIAALIGPGMARLDEAAKICKYLFVPDMDFSEAATEQLHQAGVAPVLKAVLSTLTETSLAEGADAQSIIKTVTKSENVKKGLVMRSLRAALTCDMKGPDLVESWRLLHQHGIDKTRLEQAIAIAEAASQ